MKKIKQISLMEYAQKVHPTHFRANRKFPNQQITQQAIKYRIKKGLPLPEVIKYDRVGKIHVLTVLANF
jgi:hypothetical protein